MWKVLLLVILQSFHLIYGQSGDCAQLESNKCSSCLLLPGCAWCSDVNYTSPRCNTEDKHTDFKCNMTVTGNPDVKPMLSGEILSETNQIYPRNVQAKVRVGEPLKFNLEIQPSKNYPVDFYILMDLSASMDDDLDNLKDLAVNISNKLNSLTKKSRLGFGSFVDKVVPPYVRQELVGKPYVRNDGAVKEIPYDYKHALPFTDDAQDFKAQMERQVSSGNLDAPEGTLDALMQVAACERELDWGSVKETRRMVLIATDSIFHMAGEGRFGGVVKPNDGKCHLEPENNGNALLYSKSLELDYPTLDQVKKKLFEKRIQPIFAISDPGFSYGQYEVIQKNWNPLLGATIGELDSNSGNIIQLIQDSYDAIVSTVSLQAVNVPDNVRIDIERNEDCSNVEGTNQQCLNVKPGTKVSFEVTVSATSCESGNKTSFEISASSFGQVQVDLDIVCSCDCEKYADPGSARCNGNGSLICGNCECNQGWSGEFCQCDEEKFSDIGQENCKSSNNTGAQICSGNGECYCGICQCSTIPGRTKKYYGQFCQCSDFNCPQFNGDFCGGSTRGTCKCGTCRCNRGFVGNNCGKDDCAEYVDRCLTEDERGNQVNCSGHGECSCKGVCKCDSFYEGKLCQNCPSCAGRCGDFKTCVLCEAFGVTPENATLCDNCPEVTKYSSLSLLQALNFPTTCTETDDEGCTYYYTYETKKNATRLHVVTNKDCPEGPDVLLIVLAVIGGIVGIGIILLIIWKLLTAMVDRREYQKFEQDRAKSKWHREKNPLYQPATSTVQNPTFVGSKT